MWLYFSEMGSKWRKAKMALGQKMCLYVPKGSDDSSVTTSAGRFSDAISLSPTPGRNSDCRIDMPTTPVPSSSGLLLPKHSSKSSKVLLWYTVYFSVSIYVLCDLYVFTLICAYMCVYVHVICDLNTIYFVGFLKKIWRIRGIKFNGERCCFFDFSLLVDFLLVLVCHFVNNCYLQ